MAIEDTPPKEPLAPMTAQSDPSRSNLPSFKLRPAVVLWAGLCLIVLGVMLRILAIILSGLLLLNPAWAWVCWLLYWPTLSFVMIGAGVLLIVGGISWLQFVKSIPWAKRAGLVAGTIVVAVLFHRPVVDYSLTHAVDASNEAIARLSLAMGANPNQQGKYGATPLCHASAAGDSAICQALIEHGADVNLGNPLAYATGGGEAATTKLLIQAGANVNVDNGEALVNAVRRGYPEVFRLMLDAGADLNTKDEHGMSVLEWAVDRDAVDRYDPRANYYQVAVDLINRGADVKQSGPWGENLLMAACRGDKVHAELVTLLIKNGLDVNAKSPDGETALMEEVCYGHRADIIEILLREGADPNMPGKAPEGIVTPLHKAKTDGDSPMATLLMNRGAKE